MSEIIKAANCENVSILRPFLLPAALSPELKLDSDDIGFWAALFSLFVDDIINSKSLTLGCRELKQSSEKSVESDQDKSEI